MSEVNEGVGIILARMETNPEEFFGMGDKVENKWRWIFAESLREVMTEPEKAAIFESMKRVRRLEITHKAIATIMPKDEEEKHEYKWGTVTDMNQGLTTTVGSNGTAASPKKMIVNAAQMEIAKKIAQGYK